MRLLHAASRTHARFDDPDLIGCAGLVPVVRLAERAGLPELVEEYLRPVDPLGVNAAVKVGCLVAGMVAGADSIEDMELLRNGAVGELFAGVRAPSTLGSFLRALDWGNVRQLDKVNRLFLTALAEQTPLLPGAATLAFLDVDSSQRRVFGPVKQGAAFGHTKIAGKSLLVRGLNTLESRHQLGVTFRQAGRFDEASRELAQTISAREQILGPENSRTLDSVEELARVYIDTECPGDAISLLDRALASRERQFGPDHQAVITSRETLTLSRQRVVALGDGYGL